MEFLIIGLDRADAGDLRNRLRTPHLEFVSDKQHHIKFGGPILSDDDRMVGSVLILDFPTRADLDAHLAEDPYFTSGLFEAVFIRRTRQVVPEIEPGSLAREIQRQTAGT